MKIEQRKWTAANGWSTHSKNELKKPPQLILAFGSRGILSDSVHFKEIKKMYPKSHIIMGSTAGEIYNLEVTDDSISLAAIYLEKSEIKLAEADIEKPEKSLEVGREIAEKLPKKDLVHVMVFSDGLNVNGSDLVKGISEKIDEKVVLTGGLAGDGSDFKETLVGLDEAPSSGKVIAVGFYGKHLKIGYGSMGGWDVFGPERRITRSKNNVLYEIDNQPALELYKEYLGEKAKELPSSGLLFPISLKLKNNDGKEIEVVRTLLAIDEKEKSMTFAGAIPENTIAQLMKANFDRLVDGAGIAATMSTESLKNKKAELAILVSCVGRKLVLKERIEEEIEAVHHNLGVRTPLIGFYSYGEICPTTPNEKQCRLHNQTMTITTFYEI